MVFGGSAITRASESAFPENLPDAMKPWLMAVLGVLVGVALAHWKPIPEWATLLVTSTALLFVCIVIRGHNLIRAENETKLKHYRSLLRSRAGEIQKMAFQEYKAKYLDSYNRSVFDPDTQAMLNEINSFLGSAIKGVAVDTFNSQERLKRTPALDFRSDTVNSHTMALEVELTEASKYQHLVLDRLNHYEAMLTKVISEYYESSKSNT